MAIANAVKAQRVIELQSGRYNMEGIGGEKVLFFDYYTTLMNEHIKEDTNASYSGWKSCLNMLKAYCGDDGLLFDDVDADWINGFIKFLNSTARTNGNSKPLAENTKQAYFRKLKACINHAHRNGVIARNPLANVEGLSGEETERMYLTREELQRLAATECENDNIRRAFLFSCLTGLRRSDIVSLKWRDISVVDNFFRITFKQKKTIVY